MVTELTPKLITLLRSKSSKLNDLGLLAMGYDESEEDFGKLQSLLIQCEVTALRLSTTSYKVKDILLVKANNYDR